MSALPVSRPAQTNRAVRASVTAVSCLGLVAVALVLVTGLDGTGFSAVEAAAGGIALVGFTALAVGRYDAAVVLSVALSAVVVVRPAPCDVCFSLIMLIAAITGRFHLTRAPRSAVILVSLLLALNGLSMMQAVSLSVGFRFLFITAYLLLFSLWLCGYIDSRRKMRAIVIAYLIAGVASALLGTAGYLLHIGFLEGDAGTRAQALFKDPNVYGPFLIPIAVILLDQQVRPRLLRLRPFAGLALFSILALGILFSFSRAAWTNLLIAVGIMLVTSSISRRGGRRAVRVLFGLLGVGAVIFIVLGITGSVGFLQHRAHLQSYDTQRFAAQHAGYELGWRYPVGVGPDQFQYYHDIEAHSTYVRVLAEQGFGGLLCWIAILVSTLILGVRNTLRGRDTYGIGPGALLGCWCGLIFNSAVVDTLHWRHLWLVAALIWAGAIRERASDRRPVLRRSGAGPRRGPIAVVPPEPDPV